MFQWHAWIKGLIAALVGGISTSVLAIFSSPEIFANTPDPWQIMGKIALSSAVLNFFIYLKSHPLPETVPALRLVQQEVATKIEEVKAEKDV